MIAGFRHPAVQIRGLESDDLIPLWGLKVYDCLPPALRGGADRLLKLP